MPRLLVGSVDPLAAAGLRAMLATVPDLEVVGQGAGPLQTAVLAASLQPDVIVYDAGSGSTRIDDLLTELRERGVRAPLVLLEASSSPARLSRALRDGVRGVLPRAAGLEELAAAVRAVVDGLLVLHPSLAQALPAVLGSAWPMGDEMPAEPLTAREREVLQLLAQGLANKQIAQRLGISEHTVKFHVGEVMAKLGAASRTEAVSRAARVGLLVL